MSILRSQKWGQTRKNNKRTFCRGQKCKESLAVPRAKASSALHAISKPVLKSLYNLICSSCMYFFIHACPQERESERQREVDTCSFRVRLLPGHPALAHIYQDVNASQKPVTSLEQCPGYLIYV